jgi:hypothetical protein
VGQRFVVHLVPFAPFHRPFRAFLGHFGSPKEAQNGSKLAVDATKRCPRRPRAHPNRFPMPGTRNPHVVRHILRLFGHVVVHLGPFWAKLGASRALQQPKPRLDHISGHVAQNLIPKELLPHGTPQFMWFPPLRMVSTRTQTPVPAHAWPWTRQGRRPIPKIGSE